MTDDDPPPAARVGRHPIHLILAAVPMVCFLGTLASDIAYAATKDILWGDFSDWLVSVGVIVSVFVVIAGLIDMIGRARIRAPSRIWLHAIGTIVALVLAILDALVHTRDAYGQLPQGLILSVLVVLVLAATSWLERDHGYAGRAGASGGAHA
jgi:uncharacterized membrane protein